MKNLVLITLLFLIHACPLQAQDTQYAGDPLLLGAGARALGLGGAYVALSNDATAFYWNPAGLPTLQKRELHAQHTEHFGGTVNHDILAIALPTSKGSFALAYMRLGVSGIQLTQLEDPSQPLGPDNRPVVTQNTATTDNVLFLAYARRIHNQIALGLTTKIIFRNLSAGSGNGFGFDIGLMYTLSPKTRLGLLLRDITKTNIHYDAGITDPISPNVLIGASHTLSITEQHSLLGSFGFHMGPKDAGVDGNQVVQIGMEYAFKNRLRLRLGRKGSHFTAGTGIQVSKATIDLAILEHSDLSNSYRISSSFYF